MPPKSMEGSSPSSSYAPLADERRRLLFCRTSVSDLRISEMRSSCLLRELRRVAVSPRARFAADSDADPDSDSDADDTLSTESVPDCCCRRRDPRFEGEGVLREAVCEGVDETRFDKAVEIISRFPTYW
jgi:hypothetical protein